ncbi:hypothetical protein EVB27_094 [Rhizobium phage RHph_TM16]|nr:hypothetical protein EVB27_094 [Rhizobium phage RHph_TM16]
MSVSTDWTPQMFPGDDYQRVIPRDLFNEASLLKCMGQLYLGLENMPQFFRHPASVRMFFNENAGGGFSIYQNKSDGSIHLGNVTLVVRGKQCYLYRPLNSREPYPLWLKHPESEDDIEVFTVDGMFVEFSDEMVAFLKG